MSTSSLNIAILDDWFDTLRRLPSYDALTGHQVHVFHDNEQDVDALAERLADTEVLILIRERTAIPAALVDRLSNLRLISQRSSHAHIDIDACTRNGILVCSKKGSTAPSHATVEHTWALLLASVRQLPQQMASLQAGDWQMGVGKTLHGRTLGVYGYGRIGRAVAQLGHAFGMQVQWWASDSGRERAASDGARLAESRHAFFAESDAVTVHVRLTQETVGIIGSEDLAAMRSDAVFVNTSRAQIVESGALERAVGLGHPGFVAVDVFDKEPVRDKFHPLLRHPNVVATPHIGYVTEDEWNMQFTDIYQQVLAYASGEPINMVNPQVWA